HALEYGARTEETGAPEQRGVDARLRRPAGVQPLGPGPFREIFDDSARHRADSAERINKLARFEAKGCADAGRRPNGAKHRGRMEAGLMDERGGDEAEPAHG